MRLLAFDTSGYNCFVRGLPEALEEVKKYPHMIVSPIVLGELEAGFLGGSKTQWNRDILGEFLATSSVSVVQITRDTAQRYAAIHRYLRAKGTPVPSNDIWIAASAMEHGATVLTSDRHFLKMPQVITRLLDPSSSPQARRTIPRTPQR